MTSAKTSRQAALGAFAQIGRLAVGWGTVAAFLVFGGGWLADLGDTARFAGFFLWLFAVIMWCAFGVVEQADHLAERLGEPLGTIILTLSIVIIEVVLIAAVMLGANAAPALGRDTMFAVLMIVLNGVVGLSLLLGGLRHHEQSYNLQGAVAYLAIIMPLSVIALILPSFTVSGTSGSLTTVQAFFFALFTVLLYGIFLAIQTGRHRGFFAEPRPTASIPVASIPAGAGDAANPHEPAPSAGAILRHTLLLLLFMLPIVLLAKPLATLIDHGIAVLGAPPPLGGVLIALIVFTPEAIAALRAALGNQLQRSVNLCLGASASTIGLTVPAILAIGLVTGQTIVLGLEPAEIVLLAVTLMLSTITFSGPRTTMLEGAVHLVIFFVYIVLIFSP
jgi:Ca2+:H+ antiporter